MTTESRIQNIAATADFRFANVCAGTQASSYEYQFTASQQASTGNIALPDRSPRRYLIASITKPIVAMAALKLAAEGEIALTDRIGSLLPDFGRAAYRRITVRHLLTHTSGFPDMLPDNAALRAAHAHLDEFVERARSIDLDFAPATDCRYSSIGLLLLGKIIERTCGATLPDFLTDIFFEPLGMHESWLGLPKDEADQLMPTVLPSILPNWQPDADNWGWNSCYWRTLGAPWGGMISTAADLGRFAKMMLAEGCNNNGQRILPAVVVRASMSEQTGVMSSEARFTRSTRAWGFGWRRQWPAHQASFGDFVSDSAIGHWGATGTMICIDPDADRYSVILTTTPYEKSQSAIQRISNVLTAR